MSNPQRKSRGKGIPLLLFCNICEKETPHFKKGLRCKYCQLRTTKQGELKLAHIAAEGKTIECAFEGCTVQIKVTPSQKQKFCSLTHRVSCIICGTYFQSSSKARKNTCSITCQTSYTESVILDRYGVTNAYQSEVVKAKIRATNLDRYGDEIASRTESVKLQTQATNLAIYGRPFHTQDPAIIQKIKETHLERYGGIGVASPEIRKRIGDTNIVRYGAANPFAASGFREKFEQTMIRKYGTAYPIPKLAGKSKVESELTDFIGSIYSGEIRKDRELLKGREIDIYMPELALAIEFNGTYWHRDSEAMRNTRGLLPSELHRLKQERCYDLGVTLIFVWENDWKSHRSLTEQRLTHIIRTGMEG